MTADERIATGHHEGVPAYRPRTFAAPPLGTFPIVSFIRPVGINTGIKDRIVPAMAQVESLPIRHAAMAARIERAAIERAKHPESPGGVNVVECEIIDIRDARLHRQALERFATGFNFATKVLRTGLDSESTRRDARSIFPDYDDAA